MPDMPTINGIVNRVSTNAKARLASAKDVPTDFKSGGVPGVITGLAHRFAANNRQLFPILAGRSR